MKISKITGQPFDPMKVVYITNPKQHFAYARYFGGWQYFVDMDASSDEKDGMGVFIWMKCPETREAKIKWDNHELE
jgi:hypothetical protein